MGTQASVVSCSSCGALYTPVHGDGGICAVCSPFLPSEPASRTAGTNPVATPAKPVTAAFKRPAVRSAERPHFRASRALRRVAIAAAAAVLVAGAGAFLTTRGHSLPDKWTAFRRHSLPNAWSALRHQASDAWIAVRRHLPLDEPQAPPARAAVRDATASRGTHRHAQTPVAATKAKSKRSRDDLNTAGNTP